MIIRWFAENGTMTKHMKITKHSQKITVKFTEDKDVKVLQKEGERVENLDRLRSGWWNARAGRSATAARPCSLQPAPLSYRDEHTQQYSE